MSLHYILAVTYHEYGRMTSFSNIAAQFHRGQPPNVPNMHPVSDELPVPNTVSGDARANATFVILARNSDVDGTIRSIREIEDRFNTKFGYPYVLLNEEPFTDTFMKSVSDL
jgi:alpha 1,2-mannosyltransferase